MRASACESARFWQCDDQRNKLRREGAMRPSFLFPPLFTERRRSDLDALAKEKDRTAGNADENPWAFGDLEIIYVQLAERKGARTAPPSCPFNFGFQPSEKG